MHQDFLHFKLYFTISFYGRDIGPKLVVTVWSQQVYIEDIMDATKCLSLAASGQVQLVCHFLDPLHHFEGSNNAVLEFAWSLLVQILRSEEYLVTYIEGNTLVLIISVTILQCLHAEQSKVYLVV